MAQCLRDHRPPSCLDNTPQNRPILIARDLAAWGVPEAATVEILLRRGVFKWLAVRRELIRLKHRWKAELQQRNRLLTLSKRYRDLRHLRSRWRLEHRMPQRLYIQVQHLCKSSRVQAPDNDRHAVRFLARWLVEQGGESGERLVPKSLKPNGPTGPALPPGADRGCV